MKTKSKQILEVLKVLAWIIFIGLCIKTAAVILSFVTGLFNPEMAMDLEIGNHFSQTSGLNTWKYIGVNLFLITLSALKAYMFYLVIQLLTGINLEQPFSQRVGSILVKISRTALEIAILGIISNGYIEWLVKRGLDFSYSSNSTEYFFLAGIVFVIAQIFRRGLEIQTENELTV